MAFWTSHKVQPKLKSRFVVNFGTFLLPNVKSISKPSVEISTKEYKLLNHHFNYPGIAKWNPITITFVCMGPGDDLDSGLDTADMLWKILGNSGYAVPTKNEHIINEKGDKTGLTSPEKLSAGINAFGQGLWDDTITGDKGYTPGGTTSPAPEAVVIQQLGSGRRSETKDADGNFPMEVNVTEQWTLHGPIIKSIKFGDLSYEDDNLVEYTLDIAYDYAIHEMDTGVLTSTTWNNFS